MSDSSNDVTQLIQGAAGGNRRAADELFVVVYDELRKLAAAWLHRLPPGQTLQPTALVHEAFERLVGKSQPMPYENRRHFFFVASRAMHDLIVKRAREKAAIKRGGGLHRVSIESLDCAAEAPAEDILALEEVLVELARDFPRAYQMVELRFFAGFTEEHAAEILEIPLRTAQREWQWVRAWLHKKLAPIISDSVD